MTVTKKFRELHSFSKFLLEEWSDRLEDESKTSSFKDYFEPYLKQLVKEKRVGEDDSFGAYRSIVDSIGGKSYGVYDLNFNV